MPSIPPIKRIDRAVQNLVETVDYIDKQTGEPLHGPEELPAVHDPDGDKDSE